MEIMLHVKDKEVKNAIEKQKERKENKIKTERSNGVGTCAVFKKKGKTERGKEQHD